MKILLIGNHFRDFQHNTNAWQELARQLSLKGYSIITTSEKRNKLLRLTDMLGTIWQNRKSFEVAEIDVFSGQAFLFAFASARLLNLIKKPYILILRGGNLPEYSLTHTKQIRWLLNNANAVVVPSNYLLHEMRRYREDLVLIPNAIDTNYYPFTKREQVQPHLIWLRAFHQIYNPDLAIRVLESLRSVYPNIHLIMVGPDKGDGSLQRTQKLASDLNVSHLVEFPGGIPKSEVPDWLNKGDIFINTTNFDNTPISVMEAMACGLCVVSTNVGGVPYLVENQINGLLVPKNNPVDMTAAISKVLSEPALAEQLSINARKKIEKFDWSIILPQWENLLNSLSK